MRAWVGILSCCALLAAEPSRGQSEREGIVATQSSALRVRLAPSTGSTAIAAAERGERVVILEQSGDRAWYRVRTVRGEVGWASAQYITLTEPESGVQGGAILLLIAMIAFLIWVTRRWTRSPEDRGVQWRDGASEVEFDGDGESLLGRTDPIDGTELVAGEEVFVCQTCSTAYRGDSLDYVRRQREGKCVSCRQPVNPRKLTVRGPNVVPLKQARTAR